jgi:hypothetical protein
MQSEKRMIIRATSKVLNLSKLKPEINTNELIDILPGEWYANIFSLGKPGKLGIYFVHQPTKITIMLPERSLKKAIEKLPMRVAGYLRRHGQIDLFPHFKLDTSTVEIFTSNSKSVLGHMNTIKWDIEYHCYQAERIEDIDFDWLENIFYDHLFQTKETKGEYLSTQKILYKLSKSTDTLKNKNMGCS